MTNTWGEQASSDPNQPGNPPPASPPPGNPGPAGYGYPPPTNTGYPLPSYPSPSYPSPSYFQPPPHPQSATAMILGIVGLVFCGIASPFAVWIGRKSMKEIDASGGQLSGRGQAQAGFIMGLIGSAFLALIVVIFGGSMVIGLFASIASR